MNDLCGGERRRSVGEREVGGRDEPTGKKRWGTPSIN
jgi:hypothetical protein